MGMALVNIGDGLGQVVFGARRRVVRRLGFERRHSRADQVDDEPIEGEHGSPGV